MAAADADGAQAVQFLTGAVRRIASSLDLRETLQEVVQAVVDHLGFGAAAINLALPGNIFEVVAAAGAPDLAAALLGTRAPVETWQKLLSASPIAIALLTEDRVVTRVNAAYERLTGRAAVDLIGERADELARPAVGRRSTDPATTPHDQYEVHFTRRDGTEVWAGSTALRWPATPAGRTWCSRISKTSRRCSSRRRAWLTDSLLAAADQALYRAKTAGRGQWELADDR